MNMELKQSETIRLLLLLFLKGAKLFCYLQN